MDPLAVRRNLAVDFGADGAVASFSEAQDRLADWTRGWMADAVIMTVGAGDGALLA